MLIFSAHTPSSPLGFAIPSSLGFVPDSNVHGANMGPIWGQKDPGGPYVGPRGGGGGGGYSLCDGWYICAAVLTPFFHFGMIEHDFLGYFSHPPTAKLSFGVQKLPIFTKIDLFGPKFNFFLDLFGSNFQRPAAHPHQFSGRVPPPPPGCWPHEPCYLGYYIHPTKPWLTHCRQKTDSMIINKRVLHQIEANS